MNPSLVGSEMCIRDSLFPRSNYRGIFTTGESYCKMYTLCSGGCTHHSGCLAGVDHSHVQRRILASSVEAAFGALPPAPPLLSSARVDVKAFRSLGGRTLASSWSTSQGGLDKGVGLLEQRQHKLPERGPQQPSSPSQQDILGWQTIHSNY